MIGGYCRKLVHAFYTSKYLLARYWALNECWMLSPLACDWKLWVLKTHTIVSGLKYRDLWFYNYYEYDCGSLHSVIKLVYWQILTREEEEINPTFICSPPNLQAPISLRKRWRKRDRERERRQTLSWWKINGWIGQVSACPPTMTTLINNICQSCQLTLTQKWRFRNQCCVSSVKMNSLSWIWKIPASHSFAYCCPMNIFI